MKRSSILLYIASTLLALSSCSKDDNPANPGGGNTQPEESMFVITGRKSVFLGTDILYTNGTLDSGVLTTEGTGVEQDGSSRNYITNNNYFFSLLFAQGAPGAVTSYKFNISKKFEKVSNFQTETMTVYGNVGDEILLVKNAWQPEEQYTQWFRLNAKTQEIVGRGEIDANALAGNGGKAFFTDIKKVGDKVFAPYWNVENGRTFRTDYPDSSWIAVYSYPDMKLEKVIRDGRSGAIGAYFTSGIDTDENGDTYVVGTKLNHDKAGLYSTKTPVAIMKIKKSTTEYDKSYFFNITDASGGQYIWKKTYLGKGYFLLTMCPKPYVYATPFYAAFYGGIKFAIANVYNASFKWVTGVPEASAIQSTTGDYNYSALDGTGYLGIYYTDNNVAKSTVYKFDGASATAKPGLSTDGKAAITGIFKVSVSK